MPEDAKPKTVVKDTSLRDLMIEQPDEWAAYVGHLMPSYHESSPDAILEAKARVKAIQMVQGGEPVEYEIEKVSTFIMSIPHLKLHIKKSDVNNDFLLGREALGALSAFAEKVQKMMRANMAPPAKKEQ